MAMYTFEKRDQTINLRLTKTELKLIDNLRDKRQLTSRWDKISRADVILSAIRFATGEADLFKDIP